MSTSMESQLVQPHAVLSADLTGVRTRTAAQLASPCPIWNPRALPCSVMMASPPAGFLVGSTAIRSPTAKLPGGGAGPRAPRTPPTRRFGVSKEKWDRLCCGRRPVLEELCVQTSHWTQALIRSNQVAAAADTHVPAGVMLHGH